LTVLHLIDTGGPGGAETVFHSLVTGLDPARWRSVAVVPVVDWLHGALVEHGVEPRLLEPGGSGRAAYLIRLHALMRRERVALVHAHLLGSAVYGSLAAMPGNVPVVCTFHGLPDIPEGGRLLAAKLRIIQRRRNRLVFVSESLRRALTRRHRLTADATRVIPNGVAPVVPEATGTEREELGAAPGDFLVVALGNIRPAKDYGTLLGAAAHLRAAGVPVRVAILGEGRGPLREALERERDERGLGDVVSFVGFRPDALRLLAAADAFVSSSSSEGFSLSTVEALWLARPVVATRSGGPEEIVRHGETGLLVPVGDAPALAAALAEVHRAPDEALRRARTGSLDVRERFSREAMLGHYEALYDELLGSTP
jgi:glycosyltransferase involved in cell wall biosynthesis